MTGRSSRRDVRNPLLALPAFAELQRLAPDARRALRRVLMSLSADAGDRAERSWRRKKAPMAVYWKGVSVYAKHAARGLRDA